ncbi:hypothetical protein [Streptacidiphilus rugosus]|uniref:hypothetical protein n=1 Tax=Streptacidiphilus rugosus TaxID=405783 RepID=UPI0005627E9D|nr:hypothetical protein [Streptacidiphilus rugosus]
MSLASDLLSVLGRVRGHFASLVNSGVLVTLDDHIAQIAAVVDHDVDAAEAKAKDIVGALYNALHGAPATDPLPVAVQPPADPAPVTPAAPVPVEADPAPATPVEATLASPLQADPGAVQADPVPDESALADVAEQPPAS